MERPGSEARRGAFRRVCSAIFRRLVSPRPRQGDTRQALPPRYDGGAPGPAPRPPLVGEQATTPRPTPQLRRDPRPLNDRRTTGQHGPDDERMREKHNGDYMNERPTVKDAGPPLAASHVSTGRERPVTRQRTQHVAPTFGLQRHSVIAVDPVAQAETAQHQHKVPQQEVCLQEDDYVEVLPSTDEDFLNSNISKAMKRQGEFFVRVRAEGAWASRVGAGPHVLRVNGEGVSLRAYRDERLLLTWPYTLTAKYGRSPGVFTLIAGSRCDSGPGRFSFETRDVDEVFTLVFYHIRLALPPCVTPCVPPALPPGTDDKAPHRGGPGSDGELRWLQPRLDSDCSYDYAYSHVPEERATT